MSCYALSDYFCCSSSPGSLPSRSTCHSGVPQSWLLWHIRRLFALLTCQRWRLGHDDLFLRNWSATRFFRAFMRSAVLGWRSLTPYRVCGTVCTGFMWLPLSTVIHFLRIQRMFVLFLAVVGIFLRAYLLFWRTTVVHFTPPPLCIKALYTLMSSST